MTLVFFASNNLAEFYITDYITKQYLMNEIKYNECETQRVFLKVRMERLVLQLSKIFYVSLATEITAQQPFFLWYTTQKLGFSEARENMYYYISYSHVTTFKQIKIIQKNKQGRQSTFCHI